MHALELKLDNPNLSYDHQRQLLKQIEKSQALYLGPKCLLMLQLTTPKSDGVGSTSVLLASYPGRVVRLLFLSPPFF